MTKVLSFVAQKGGTSKTTSCEVVGSILTKKGYKVLLIDLDGQMNLSSILMDYEEIEKHKNHNAFTFLFDEDSLENCVVKFSEYDLLVGSSQLYRLEELSSYEGELDFTELKECLENRNGYDFILIDTPPNLGNLQREGIIASDYIILNVLPNQFSYIALERIEDTLKFCKGINKNSVVLGVLISKYSERKNVNKALKSDMEELAKDLGTKLFKTCIRETAKVEESQAVGKSLISYAPKCNAFIDYMELTEEILKRIKKGV